MSTDESVSDAELVRDATEQIWQKDVTQRQVEEAVGGAVRRARSDERRKLWRAQQAAGEAACLPPDTLGALPEIHEPDVGSARSTGSGEYERIVRREIGAQRDRILRDLADGGKPIPGRIVLDPRRPLV